jgi:H+/Cl- antiporter ClcA
MTMRYIKMLLLGALAGILSGFIWLFPNGLMGGALGMSLAAGAIWLGRLRSQQGAEPTRRQVLLAGLVSGLLAGLLMAAISHACSRMRRNDFGPPVLPFWAPLAMGILYGPVVLWGYSVRKGFFDPLASALLSTCLACFALKTLAAFSYLMLFEHGTKPGGILLGSAMDALLGAAPFALLWVLGMAWSDPNRLLKRP